MRPVAAVWIVFLAACVMGTGAAAQQSGGTTSGNTGRSTRTPPVGRSENRRPLVIFGNVEMEDGTALPGNVVIERVCNGSARKEGNADATGHFSIELGGAAVAFQDSSDSDAGVSNNAGISSRSPAAVMAGMPSLDTAPGFNRRALYGCELRAAWGGFASTAVDISRFQTDDVGNVGTIFLQRKEKVQGTSISMTTLQAPKDAKKAFERAASARKRANISEEKKELQKAVTIYPKYAAAWNQLGGVFLQSGELAEAQHAYEQAVMADPRFVDPYFPLAQLASGRHDWKQVLSLSARGLEMDPLSHPEGYFYRAVAQYNLGDLNAAEKDARKGERLDQSSRMPRVHLLLYTILARQKNYAEAVTELKSYLRLVPNGSDSAALKDELAKVEKLSSQPSATPQ